MSSLLSFPILYLEVTLTGSRTLTGWLTPTLVVPHQVLESLLSLREILGSMLSHELANPLT
jgi:uncharacterized protein (DUF983 family)